MHQSRRPLSRCHCDALRRATRALSHFYDEQLAGTGLTTPQFALLRTVEATGPASISTVARKLSIDRTTLGRNLRPLANAGLVDFKEDARDARERHVALTPKGLAVIDRAKPVWAATQATVEARFGADKLATLHALLTDLRAAAEPGRR